MTKMIASGRIMTSNELANEISLRARLRAVRLQHNFAWLVPEMLEINPQGLFEASSFEVRISSHDIITGKG